MDLQIIIIGIGSGISLYYFGKLLKLIGFRFGRDIIYEDFDRLSIHLPHYIQGPTFSLRENRENPLIIRRKRVWIAGKWRKKISFKELVII